MIWKSLNGIRRMKMSWREIVRLREKKIIKRLDLLEEPVTNR